MEMSNVPETWQCIGGPVTRPEDNRAVTIYVDLDTPEGCCNIRVSNGYSGSDWSITEVRRFGNGDLQEGITVMLGLLATASIKSLTDSRRYPPLPGE